MAGQVGALYGVPTRYPGADRHKYYFSTFLVTSTILVLALSNYFELGASFSIFPEDSNVAALEELPVVFVWLVGVLGWRNLRRTQDLRAEVDQQRYVAAARNALVVELGRTNRQIEAILDQRTKALQEEHAVRLCVERQLRAKQNQLAHAGRLNLMGEMATGLAHELNQPLFATSNYIAASLQRIKSGRGDLPSIGCDLNHALVQTKRAGDIIRRLRCLVRQEPLKSDRIDMNALVREVIELLEFETREHSVEIAVDLDPSVPDVVGDSIQIQQVIINLVRNSVQALHATNSNERRVTVCTARAVDGRALVRVMDNGPGVPRNRAETIFEPFKTSKQDGLGMGLTISRTIAHSHGGSLTLEPLDRQGASFLFVLPAVSDEASE